MFRLQPIAALACLFGVLTSPVIAQTGGVEDVAVALKFVDNVALQSELDHELYLNSSERQVILHYQKTGPTTLKSSSSSIGNPSTVVVVSKRLLPSIRSLPNNFPDKFTTSRTRKHPVTLTLYATTRCINGICSEFGPTTVTILHDLNSTPAWAKSSKSCKYLYCGKGIPDTFLKLPKITPPPMVIKKGVPDSICTNPYAECDYPPPIEEPEEIVSTPRGNICTDPVAMCVEPDPIIVPQGIPSSTARDICTDPVADCAAPFWARAANPTTTHNFPIETSLSSAVTTSRLLLNRNGPSISNIHLPPTSLVVSSPWSPKDQIPESVKDIIGWGKRIICIFAICLDPEWDLYMLRNHLTRLADGTLPIPQPVKDGKLVLKADDAMTLVTGMARLAPLALKSNTNLEHWGVGNGKKRRRSSTFVGNGKAGPVAVAAAAAKDVARPGQHSGVGGGKSDLALGSLNVGVGHTSLELKTIATAVVKREDSRVTEDGLRAIARMLLRVLDSITARSMS